MMTTATKLTTCTLLIAVAIALLFTSRAYAQQGCTQVKMIFAEAAYTLYLIDGGGNRLVDIESGNDLNNRQINSFIVLRGIPSRIGIEIEDTGGSDYRYKNNIVEPGDRGYEDSIDEDYNDAVILLTPIDCPGAIASPQPAPTPAPAPSEPNPPPAAPEGAVPSIQSVSADDITETTARAVVDIADHDGTELTVKLRYQKKAEVQDWPNAHTDTATSSASRAAENLENLTPDTEYVLQASFDDTFPDDATKEYAFTTERRPSIQSVSADDITKTTARAVVDIADHDGTELTVKLRYQKKAEVQDWPNAHTDTATSSASPATKNLENLTPGTEYVLQASFDDTFPDDATKEYTFTTERRPSIQSVSVSNIGLTSARATINIANSDGSTQTAKLQYRSTNPQGQWSEPPFEENSMVATAVIDLNGLTSGTGYELQAWLATDEADKDTATFRTSQAQQQKSQVVQEPSISSVTFINIMQTSAITNVILRNAGTAQKTVRLRYRAGGTTAWSTPAKTSMTKSSDTAISLTSLTAGTTYEAQVWLTSSSPPSGTSTYTFTTLDEVVPDPSISALEFENVGQTSATAIVKIADAGTEMKEVYLKHSMGGTDEWAMLSSPAITYTDSTSINLTELQEGTTYDVAVALTGDLSPMVMKSFTTLSAPSLSGVTVEDITKTTATAEITIADPDGTGQTVHLRYRATTPQGDWSDTQTTSSTPAEASTNLTGLTADKKYEIEVSLSSDFTGSVTSTFTTLPPDPSLSDVTVDEIRQITATAEIDIADPDGTGQTVRLRYRTTTPQGEWSSTQTATSTTAEASIDLTGLTADTKYEIEVSLDSAFDNTVSTTFTTLRYPSLSHLDVTDITKTTATAEITIADPDGTGQTVHLRYRATTPQGDWSDTQTTSSTTAEASIGLTGLTTDTEYEVEASLTSDFVVSVTEAFTTLPRDPVVSDVSVSSIRQTTATAYIDIANSNGSSRTVSLRYRTTTQRGDWSGTLTTTSNMDSASIDLSGLTPGTEYDVQASLDGSFPTARTK